MHAFFKCMAGEMRLCGDSSSAEAEHHRCNCFHSRFHEQIMRAARVLMLPSTYKEAAACQPSVRLPLFFHCFLVQTLGTAPPGGQQALRTWMLASRVYGHRLILANHVKTTSEAEPQTLASPVLCCLLSTPPVLRNAQHCLLAFCKYAFTWPPHLSSKPLVYCHL